jgi:pimeloyl-ACP methyl ester carboxylesterase
VDLYLERRGERWKAVFHTRGGRKLGGMGDRLSPPEYSDYFNQAVRGLRLVPIPVGGHVVTLETPTEVIRAIEAFAVPQ